MAAYIIAEVEVIEPAAYEEYRKLAGPLVEKFGGRYLVRGGAATALEGEPWHRIVVLEFPDAAAARRFYDSGDYQKAMRIRGRTARSRLVLVEGT